MRFSMDSSEVDDDDAFLFQDDLLPKETSPAIEINNDCSCAEQMINVVDLADADYDLFNFPAAPNFANYPPTQPDSPFFLDIYDFGQQHPALLEGCSSDNHITTYNDQYYNSLISLYDQDYDHDQLGQLDVQVETTAVYHDDDQTAANLLIFNSSTADDDHHLGAMEDNNSGKQDGENLEEDQTADDHLKLGALNCKNLKSERNRRKRLGQQLLALRALVPNITKMDKRSVLVDALNYLRSIREETERLQKELKQSRSITNLRDHSNKSCHRQDNTIEAHRITRMLASPSPSAAKSRAAQITEIETEKIEDRRFVVKMTCKGSIGVGGDILRVFESLGFEITYSSLQQMRPQEMSTMMFIRVRKPGKMTEQKLKDCITSMALRTGFTLQSP